MKTQKQVIKELVYELSNISFDLCEHEDRNVCTKAAKINELCHKLKKAFADSESDCN